MKNNSPLLLLGFLIIVVLFSGCGQTEYCGDNVCSNGETQASCPTDCGSTTVQYHSECQNQQCIQVEGKGTDQCQTNEDCTASNALIQSDVTNDSIGIITAKSIAAQTGSPITVQTGISGTTLPPLSLPLVGAGKFASWNIKNPGWDGKCELNIYNETLSGNLVFDIENAQVPCDTANPDLFYWGFATKRFNVISGKYYKATVKAKANFNDIKNKFTVRVRYNNEPYWTNMQDLAISSPLDGTAEFLANGETKEFILYFKAMPDLTEARLSFDVYGERTLQKPSKITLEYFAVREVDLSQETQTWDYQVGGACTPDVAEVELSSVQSTPPTLPHFITCNGIKWTFNNFIIYGIAAPTAAALASPSRLSLKCQATNCGGLWALNKKPNGDWGFIDLEPNTLYKISYSYTPTTPTANADVRFRASKNLSWELKFMNTLSPPATANSELRSLGYYTLLVYNPSNVAETYNLFSDFLNLQSANGELSLTGIRVSKITPKEVTPVPSIYTIAKDPASDYLTSADYSGGFLYYMNTPSIETTGSDGNTTVNYTVFKKSTPGLQDAITPITFSETGKYSDNSRQKAQRRIFYDPGLNKIIILGSFNAIVIDPQTMNVSKTPGPVSSALAGFVVEDADYDYSNHKLKLVKWAENLERLTFNASSESFESHKYDPEHPNETTTKESNFFRAPLSSQVAVKNGWIFTNFYYKKAGSTNPNPPDEELDLWRGTRIGMRIGKLDTGPPDNKPAFNVPTTDFPSGSSVFYLSLFNNDYFGYTNAKAGQLPNISVKNAYYLGMIGNPKPLGVFYADGQGITLPLPEKQQVLAGWYSLAKFYYDPDKDVIYGLASKAADGGSPYFIRIINALNGTPVVEDLAAITGSTQILTAVMSGHGFIVRENKIIMFATNKTFIADLPA